MTQPLESWRAENAVSLSSEKVLDRTDPCAQNFQAGDRHWSVTLYFASGASMTIPFTQGSAWTTDPSTDDVLECLASDAAGFENAGSFESWASEYGYDTDSRKAGRIFEAVEKQSTELRACLGNEAYESLLWETERS